VDDLVDVGPVDGDAYHPLQRRVVVRHHDRGGLGALLASHPRVQGRLAIAAQLLGRPGDTRDLVVADLDGAVAVGQHEIGTAGHPRASVGAPAKPRCDVGDLVATGLVGCQRAGDDGVGVGDPLGFERLGLGGRAQRAARRREAVVVTDHTGAVLS